MRSIIFFIVMIVVAGTADVSWQLVHLSRIHQLLHDANITIQKNAELSNHKNQNDAMRHAGREQIIDTFLTWIGVNGLTLSTLTVTENGEADDGLDIHAEISGSFQKMVRFLNDISRQCFPFLIQSAIISKTEVGIKLKLEAMIATRCVHARNKPVFIIHDIDPFLKIESENGISHFSVRQIQLVGFVRYSDHLSAIIRMPDGRAKEIIAGDLLGNENAIVMHIHEKNITIQLNGKIQNITRE